MKIPPESPICYCNIHSVEQESLLSKPKCSVRTALCTSNTAGASTTELQAPPKLPPQLLCGEERRAALRGDNGELEAGTPFPRCQCPQNKDCQVCSTAQWVWGKHPMRCCCSASPPREIIIKGLLARNAGIFYCAGCRWSIPGYGCEEQRADGRLSSSVQSFVKQIAP